MLPRASRASSARLCGSTLTCSRSTIIAGRAAPDLDTVRAHPAGLGALSVQAVDRLGQDAGGRRLPGSAYSRKQVGVGDTALFDRVLQGLGNRILPNQVAKRLRPVLEVKGLVRHRLPRQFYGPASTAALSIVIGWRGLSRVLTLPGRAHHVLGFLTRQLPEQRDRERSLQDG